MQAELVGHDQGCGVDLSPRGTRHGWRDDDARRNAGDGGWRPDLGKHTGVAGLAAGAEQPDRSDWRDLLPDVQARLALEAPVLSFAGHDLVVEAANVIDHVPDRREHPALNRSTGRGVLGLGYP